MRAFCLIAALLAANIVAAEDEALNEDLPQVTTIRRFMQDGRQLMELTLRQDGKDVSIFIDLAKTPEAQLLQPGDRITGEYKKENRTLWMTATHIIGANGLPITMVTEDRARRIRAIDASKNPIVVTLDDGTVYKIDGLLHPWYVRLKKGQGVCFDYVQRSEDRWAHAATIRLFAPGVPDTRLETWSFGVEDEVETVVWENQHVCQVTTRGKRRFWIDVRVYPGCRHFVRGFRLPFGALIYQNRHWQPQAWWVKHHHRHRHHMRDHHRGKGDGKKHRGGKHKGGKKK